MYAHDLVLWCKEEHATTAQLRLQEAANIFSNWTRDWCVKINKTKSFTTLFTLSTKAKHIKIILEDVDLQHTDSTTYLGVTFDKKTDMEIPYQRCPSKLVFNDKFFTVDDLHTLPEDIKPMILSEVWSGDIMLFGRILR